MIALTFVVPGRPIPLGRPRVFRNRRADGGSITRTITPDRSMAYRERVQLLARAAISAARWEPTADERYELALWIYWADARRTDGSNVLKAIEDAGNGLVWPDDSQIDRGHFFCAIDRKDPRVEVQVSVLADGGAR